MSGGKKRRKSLGIISTLGDFIGNIFDVGEENSTLRPFTKEDWQRAMIDRMAELYQVSCCI